MAQIDEGSRGFQGKMSFESGTSWVMGSQTVIWEEGARQRESKCKGLEMGACLECSRNSKEVIVPGEELEEVRLDSSQDMA